MRPESPANSAAREPDPALEAWLVAQGFPPDDLEGLIANRTTPLVQACRLGERAIVEALLAAGARLDAVNGDGNNALWLACFKEDLAIIDKLVENGVALDHQNDGGSTALMYAASAGKTAVVARLLEAGADVGLQNHDDFTALDMAANLECLQLLRAASRRHSATT
ncbi:ankyrin repeat domain-containing protein [Methylococcus sp. EFPC2]|uniref:ankyrin repeat domain-containing protein n=1 Tax=Methylococcus sp. EFPC2 TaxID=2812648 RepID=UPI001F0738AD|nr:ankyrin repeat domain-containing protein [Methylococcus sp. EFPC2]